MLPYFVPSNLGWFSGITDAQGYEKNMVDTFYARFSLSVHLKAGKIFISTSDFV